MMILVLLLSFSAISMACASDATKDDNNATKNAKTEDGKVQKIDQAQFRQLVWDYQTNAKEWSFVGERPAVVDFYADWCGPCRRVAPIMEKLATEFKGQIDIYKVNVDHNKELSGVFGINSIPAILFIPKDGKPALQPGLLQEEQYRQIFNEFVLGKKVADTENNVQNTKN